MLKGVAREAENTIASVAFGGIMLLPLAEIASRRFPGAAIPGSGAIAATLTLWLGMLGAAIAARDGKLLTLATGEFLPKGRISAVAHVIAGTIGAMISTILAIGGGRAGPEAIASPATRSPLGSRPGLPTSRCRSASA